MSRVQTYIDQQLGATGFVLCEPGIAYRVRPDIWPTLTNCETDFSPMAKPVAKSVLANRAPVLFVFEGKGRQGYGGCFNPQRLEDRIQELYGIEVTVMVVDSLTKTADHAQGPAGSIQREQKRIQDLRALANEELPGHDCPRRHEILEARHKLELGVTYGMG